MTEIFPPFKYRHSAAERMGLVRKKSVHKKKRHLILPKIDSSQTSVAQSQSSSQPPEIVKLPPLNLLLDAISEEESGFWWVAIYTCWQCVAAINFFSITYMSLTDMLHISMIDLIQPFCFQWCFQGRNILKWSNGELGYVFCTRIMNVYVMVMVPEV